MTPLKLTLDPPVPQVHLPVAISVLLHPHYKFYTGKLAGVCTEVRELDTCQVSTTKKASDIMAFTRYSMTSYQIPNHV
jgi:hypothetical protein